MSRSISVPAVVFKVTSRRRRRRGYSRVRWCWRGACWSAARTRAAAPRALLHTRTHSATRTHSRRRKMAANMRWPPRAVATLRASTHWQLADVKIYPRTRNDVATDALASCILFVPSENVQSDKATRKYCALLYESGGDGGARRAGCPSTEGRPFRPTVFFLLF